MKDWSFSSLITIDGVGIPVGLWKKVYCRTRPPAWKQMKDQWTKYKFIVAGYKSFPNSEAFWEAMSFPPTMASGDRISFKRISNKLRSIRIERDQVDAERAREEYSDVEFQSIFRYRKGGKQHVMKKDQDIARHYRLQLGTPAYWDEEDSDEN